MTKPKKTGRQNFAGFHLSDAISECISALKTGQNRLKKTFAALCTNLRNADEADVRLLGSKADLRC
ncbi:MAG: hypothetical protein ACJAWC_002051 [Yoonia sp.]|jgi:hypothetical protein